MNCFFAIAAPKYHRAHERAFDDGRRSRARRRMPRPRVVNPRLRFLDGPVPVGADRRTP